MQVLTAMLAMVALAACQPDAALDMDEATITISTLEVQVQQMGSMADTRAAGTNSVVKTEFEAGDVLHIKVALTVDDAKAGKIKYYTATYTDVNGTGTAAWTLNKPIVLPQDATNTAMIEAYYGDVLNYEYTAEEFMTAFDAASKGTPTEDGKLTMYTDLLMALGMNNGSGWVSDNGITITPAGKLTIKMVHYQALLRISSITNNLGGDVTGIVANFTNSTINPVPLTLIPAGMPPTTTPMVKAEAIAISGQNLASFTVTLMDGSSGSTRDIIVDAPGYNSNPAPGGDTGSGTKLEDGECYTYKLLLNPGSLTAIPTDGSIGDAPAWDDKGTLGYIPIYNRAELEKIGTDPAMPLTGKYILMNDIDLTGSNWTPIGTNAFPFTGTFNGNGHIIKGMTITGNAELQGLFGYIDGNAILYNIHLRDVNVTAKEVIGALVGYAFSSSISVCSSTGTVSGAKHVGGLVGNNNGCHITRCWSTAEVSGSGNYIGGLVGANGGANGTIVASYTQGSIVSGIGNVGGLVGYNSATIFGCYAAQATVSGNSDIGALVGRNNGGTVTSCYATNKAGNTTTKLVGDNGNNGTFTACISPLAFNVGTEEGSIAGITGSGNYAALVTAAPTASINVRTVVVTDGAIEVDRNGKPTERTWSATSIWGISTGTSSVALAPHIKWDYHGEK